MNRIYLFVLFLLVARDVLAGVNDFVSQQLTELDARSVTSSISYNLNDYRIAPQFSMSSNSEEKGDFS